MSVALVSKARPAAVSVRCSVGIFVRRSDVPNDTSSNRVPDRSIRSVGVLDIHRVLQVNQLFLSTPRVKRTIFID